MHALRVGARGIVYDARARMDGFGVRILTHGPDPDLPWGFRPPLSTDYGGLGDELHCCRKEPGIVIVQGGFVAFDVLVQARCGSRYRAKPGFSPFFTGEVHIYHDDLPTPDLTVWRPLKGAAAAICCLAQNPWLRSVAFTTGLPCGDIAEAYMRSGNVIVDWAPNPRHHIAYVRTDSVPVSYWALTEERY